MYKIISRIARALDNEETPYLPPSTVGPRRWVDGGTRAAARGGVCRNGRKFKFRERRRRRGEGSAPVLPRATSVSGSPAFGTDLNGRDGGKRVAAAARTYILAARLK